MNNNDVAQKMYEDGRQLFHAIQEGMSIDIIRTMISLGCAVDAVHPIHDYRALNLAVRRADVELVKLLLAQGADASLRGESGKTAMGSSILWEDSQSCEILQLLIDAGAKPRVDNRYLTSEVLDLCAGGTREALEILLKHGVKLTAGNCGGNTPLHALARNYYHKNVLELFQNIEFDVNIKNCVGHSLLHSAVMSQNIEYIRLLLKKGADPNCKCNDGHTPLYVALKYKRWSTQHDYIIVNKLVRLLLENGANVDELLDGKQVVMEPVVEHLAIFEARGLPIQGWHKHIQTDAKLNSYYDKCRQEIKKMQHFKIESISFFNILIDSVDKVSKYVRNQSNVEFFKSYDIDLQFPCYASLLKWQLENAIKKQKSMQSAAMTVCNLLEFGDPDHIAVEKITSYLSTEDLYLLNQK